MAQRLQHKRSSVAGRRPDNRYLEPGELALNTNASDPGLYFELNDGTIAKAGPTSIGLTPPDTEVGHGTGEAWFDSGNRTLSTYFADLDEWVASLSPMFGGDATLMFVGTNFDDASDSLSNDGSARPFATLNRACLEVARRSILPGRPDKVYNKRFVIVLLPGENIVENSPGLSRTDFDDAVGLYSLTTTLSPEELVKFNPVDGSVVLPRGTSIIGLDQHKTLIRPTYYPSWTREGALAEEDSENKPATSILRWTGNSFIHNLTFRDKKEEVSVTSITGEDDEVAELKSLFPHGFKAVERDDNGLIIGADTVTLTYPNGISQTYEGEQTLPSGDFWVVPSDQFTFQLSSVGATTSVTRRELPKNPTGSSDPSNFLTLTHSNKTHHQLASVSWTSDEELSDFYYKIQRAFGSIPSAGISLNNTVGNAEIANPGETAIVATLTSRPSQALDNSDETAPHMSNVAIRSNWGMCGLHSDGAQVTGFKAAEVTNMTAVMLQNDPEVYEVYYNNEWISLRAAATAYNQLVQATDSQAMEFLINEVSLNELRYFYRAASDIEGQSGKSSGLVDPNTDVRHYAVLAENSATVQVKTADIVGAAVGFWTKSGATLFSSSSTTALGGESLRSEGFAGIGTITGALDTDQGFNIYGIRRPAQVTASQLRDSDNHAFIPLNASIASLSTTANTITLAEPFDKGCLGPYTLRPGTVIWVRDLTDDSLYSATIASSPVSPDGLTIALDSSNDNITSQTLANLSIPYIRRFVDPRTAPQRAYHLWVNNTSSNHRPPVVGSMLRFDHTPSTGVSTLIVSGRQLDPGANGGWNHLFRVSGASTKQDGDRPTFANESRSDVAAISNYYVSLDLCDGFKPWIGDNDGYFYSRGQFSTREKRVFYAEKSVLRSGTEALVPQSDPTVWREGKTFVVGQPMADTWIPTSFTSVDDPDKSFYDTDSDIYPRGLSVEPSSYIPPYYIDSDDGSATLGLQSSTDPTVADPAVTDPEWMPSKAAMTRFVTMMGYEPADVSALLQPAKWSERNVSTIAASLLTEPDGTGYATGKGAWPVEFCEASRVVAVGHTWKEPGFISYSKGLPVYQASGLTNRQRFDAVTSEAWGGSVLASGVTESNEYVNTRFVPVDGAGRTLKPFVGIESDLISQGSLSS